MIPGSMTDEGMALAEETLSISSQFISKFNDLLSRLAQHGGYYLWDILVICFILLAAKGILRVVSALTKRAMGLEKYHRTVQQGKRVDTMMTLLRSVARYGIYFVAFLMILQQLGWGKAMENLLVTAGIGSLAIGFGAQNLVRDVVTGFFMMFENQFSVGDYIKTGDAEGTVEATAMRVTYLRSLQGDQIIIPNGSIERVVNYSRGSCTSSVTISTAYEADTRQVIWIIKEAMKDYAREHSDLIVEPPVVLGITDFGASSVDIGILCKAKPLKQWEVERGIRLAVKEQFDRLGVEFPYPHIVTMPYEKPTEPLAMPPSYEEEELPQWAVVQSGEDEDS